MATMRFYPDVFAAEGGGDADPEPPPRTDPLEVLVARAPRAPTPPAAIEDCRRAIRWGRLLRQEDAHDHPGSHRARELRIGAEQL